jgi:hypothetical protein
LQDSAGAVSFLPSRIVRRQHTRPWRIWRGGRRPWPFACDDQLQLWREMAPRGSTSKRKVESDSDSDVEIVAVKKAPAATRKSKVTKRESSSDPDIKPVLQKPPAKRPKIEDEGQLTRLQ